MGFLALKNGYIMKKILAILVGLFMLLLTTFVSITLPQVVENEMDMGQKFLYWWIVFSGYFVSFIIFAYKLGKQK